MKSCLRVLMWSSQVGVWSNLLVVYVVHHVIHPSHQHPHGAGQGFSGVYHPKQHPQEFFKHRHQNENEKKNVADTAPGYGRRRKKKSSSIDFVNTSSETPASPASAGQPGRVLRVVSSCVCRGLHATVVCFHVCRYFSSSKNRCRSAFSTGHHRAYRLK
ncbi:hypothetical protein PoB_004162000 [Plakobranchus ocellatus]|uniref:Secreted protein n=1 Tax=Plakobranchus ocellatus TaxID=259542 RepID=A0AAV4B3A4_9GAST|nr:hypothetical protein PoB_004162000 [Plakobranchus ocellatus]